jgi:hypothetical protein
MGTLMAKRPIYIPDFKGASPVRTQYVDFHWSAGLSVLQKQKSITSLHDAANKLLGMDQLLEVSSKSPDTLGVALSAFNLTFMVPTLDHPLSVECAFQGSKVFEGGGPFTDMFKMISRDAKRDERLQRSGRLIGFRFTGSNWGLEPQTAFYDWLYINALKARMDLTGRLSDYSAFTDIEFNPEKSINCQAHSVALFVSLQRANCLEEATSSQEAFLDFLGSRSINNARQNDAMQGRLF